MNPGWISVALSAISLVLVGYLLWQWRVATPRELSPEHQEQLAGVSGPILGLHATRIPFLRNPAAADLFEGVVRAGIEALNRGAVPAQVSSFIHSAFEAHVRIAAPETLLGAIELMREFTAAANQQAARRTEQLIGEIEALTAAVSDATRSGLDSIRAESSFLLSAAAPKEQEDLRSLQAAFACLATALGDRLREIERAEREEGAAEIARKANEAAVEKGHRLLCSAEALVQRTAGAGTLEQVEELRGELAVLLQEAGSSSITGWDSLSECVSRINHSLYNRSFTIEQNARAEAERLAAKERAEAVQQAAQERAAQLKALLDRAAVAARGLSSCRTTAEASALRTRVEHMISRWYAQSDEEQNRLDEALLQFRRQVDTWIETREQSARQAHVRDAVSLADRLAHEGKHESAVLVLFGLWREEPDNTDHFDLYLKAVMTGAEALPVDQATRLLVDAEAGLRELKQFAKAPLISHADRFAANLSNAKNALHDRISQQRATAFEELLQTVRSFEDVVPTVQTREDLFQFRDEAETQARAWGQMNERESVAWKATYDSLVRALVDRDNQLKQNDAEMRRAAALNAADQTLAELQKVQAAAEQAKTRADLNLVLEEMAKIKQPDLSLLSDAKQDSLANSTRHVQEAVQKAEARIVSQLRSNYNQMAVREIDGLFERLKTESNRRANNVRTLAGGLAAVETGLLEPAIFQYYQVCIAKALEQLDDEADKKFMELIAQTVKTGLEG